MFLAGRSSRSSRRWQGVFLRIRFAHLSDRLAQLSGRFAHLGGRFAHLGGRFAQLSGRFSHLSGRFAHLSGQFSHLSGQFSHLSGRFAHLPVHLPPIPRACPHPFGSSECCPRPCLHIRRSRRGARTWTLGKRCGICPVTSRLFPWN